MQWRGKSHEWLGTWMIWKRVLARSLSHSMVCKINDSVWRQSTSMLFLLLRLRLLHLLLSCLFRKQKKNNTKQNESNHHDITLNRSRRWFWLRGNENFRTFVSLKHPQNEKSTAELDSYSFFLCSFLPIQVISFLFVPLSITQKRVEDVFNDMTDRQCLATAVTASTKHSIELFTRSYSGNQ